MRRGLRENLQAGPHVVVEVEREVSVGGTVLGSTETRSRARPDLHLPARVAVVELPRLCGLRLLGFVAQAGVIPPLPRPEGTVAGHLFQQCHHLSPVRRPACGTPYGCRLKLLVESLARADQPSGSYRQIPAVWSKWRSMEKGSERTVGRGWAGSSQR